MSVPQAHSTPKLESLPKGLRAKAEAIINKKFGLIVEPKKKKTSLIAGIHFPDPSLMTTTVSRCSPNLERITFNRQSELFETVIMCHNCRKFVQFIHSIEQVRGRGWMELVRCNCGQGSLFISDSTFRDAYSRARDDRAASPYFLPNERDFLF